MELLKSNDTFDLGAADKPRLSQFKFILSCRRISQTSNFDQASEAESLETKFPHAATTEDQIVARRILGK